jgi:hypothetical protein
MEDKMEAWLLILVMINPTTPHILTIPVETYETEAICRAELEILTEEANDTSGQATLVCLKDIRLPDDFEPANESEETWDGVCPIPGDTIPCNDTILMAWYTSLFNGD